MARFVNEQIISESSAHLTEFPLREAPSSRFMGFVGQQETEIVSPPSGVPR
jgi:hypothetical protein